MVILINEEFVKNFYTQFKDIAIGNETLYIYDIGVKIDNEPMSFEQLNKLLEPENNTKIKSICTNFSKIYAQL